MINLRAARCSRWGVAAGGPEAQRKLWGRPGPTGRGRFGSKGTSTVESFEKWQNIGPSSQFSDAEFWRHPNWNDAPKLTCCFFLHLGWNHPYFAVTWQTQLLGRYMKVCNRQQTTQEKGLSVTTWAYHGCFPCPPLTTRSAGLISALWNPASSF